LRLGGCLAAEERRRRWPAEAWKDDWEASVTCPAGKAARNVENAAARCLRRQVGKAECAAGTGGSRAFQPQRRGAAGVLCRVREAAEARQ
jgi:hypothetical protein